MFSHFKIYNLNILLHTEFATFLNKNNTTGISKRSFLFGLIDSLRPSQHLFSYVWTCLPG